MRAYSIQKGSDFDLDQLPPPGAAGIAAVRAIDDTFHGGTSPIGRTTTTNRRAVRSGPATR